SGHPTGRASETQSVTPFTMRSPAPLSRLRGLLAPSDLPRLTTPFHFPTRSVPVDVGLLTPGSAGGATPRSLCVLQSIPASPRPPAMPGVPSQPTLPWIVPHPANGRTYMPTAWTVPAQRDVLSHRWIDPMSAYLKAGKPSQVRQLDNARPVKWLRGFVRTG